MASGHRIAPLQVVRREIESKNDEPNEWETSHHQDGHDLVASATTKEPTRPSPTTPVGRGRVNFTLLSPAANRWR